MLYKGEDHFGQQRLTVLKMVGCLNGREKKGN